MNRSGPNEDTTADGPDTAGQLLPLVYAELRELARRKMLNEPAGHTLQTTDLVHEAYVRLAASDVKWDNRRHFFAAAAEAMRRIVIDRARARARIKRGGGRERVTLPKNVVGSGPPPEEVLALNEVLARLERQDSTMADVVKLRYFAGFTVPETARALNLSLWTVNRLWTAARAWLHDEIRS